jgi:hypothetical protein
MNTNLLKEKSLNKETAYTLFIFQSHYAYFGKWKIQIIYWLSWCMVPLLIIWPINQFFAIPNKVKKHNLKVYEELLNS